MKEKKQTARQVRSYKLRQKQSEAVKNACEQYDNDLVEISSHGTECEVCREFEGKVFSISGKHPIYPKLKKWPPFCQNCGHSASPTSDIAIESRKNYK